MYPETKFKADRRTTSGYQSPNNIYSNLDQYLNNRTSATSSHEMSHIGNNTQDYRNRSFEYHEKYGNSSTGESSNLLNKTTSYGLPTKKTYPQRKSLYTAPVTKSYASQITSPKSYSSGIVSPTESQKPKASLSAYNLIPKSLLSDETKKPTPPAKENKTTAQNTTTNKRNSLGQYPVTKAGHNKRSSVNYDTRRRSQSHPTKSKSDNVLQKPKLGVIGVLSAKKSLNEFSKRSSRVLNQQTEEINNLKARIQELTSDQEILRKLNEVSSEDTLLEFNDKYLTPLLNKMSTYLMKFSSEYNEMIKSNSDFIDSQHDRTECLVELAANLNSQLHNFIEGFECDRFDERTYNEKRGQVDVIADTTSRLNSQLARVVLQLDDFRDSPDFQKENMTNSIQSLGVILQQLNKAAITVNQKIAEYENTLQQKDELFIRDQNSKDIEIDALKHKIRELTVALDQKPIVRELETQNRELMNVTDAPVKVVMETVSNEALEKYKNDLVRLNHNLSNVTLLFDSEIQHKSGLMKTQEQKLNDLTERYAKLNTQLAKITLLFDSEINLKDKIIKDKESQIERLRKNAAELNHNLSVLSLLSNEKDIANKREVNDLMETISNLRMKWAAINTNLLTLTSTVNDQLRSKNEEIRLNKQDAVYFRDFTTQIYNQMMDYLGDFLQRIWDKNHENEILIEKNRDLMNYCSDLNGRVARFTLEINDLQKEKNILMSKLANNTSMPMITREVPVQQPVVECRADTGLWWLFYKPQTTVVTQQTREIVYVQQAVDDAKVEYYRNMAVDLNTRVAMLTLDIDSLKLNKFNEDIIEDESTINFFKNQAVALNSNLAKLTLEHNDFKNQELVKMERLIRNSEEKIEFYQQMAANLNTRLAMLSLEMNNENKSRDVVVSEDKQIQYYQTLIENLNIKINNLLIENEELKSQQFIQTRNISQDVASSVNIVKVVKDESEINRFRDLAVDLNTRLAKLTLEFNEKPKSVESVDSEYIKKIQTQVVELNQRLAILTLNANDEVNALKRKIAQMQTGEIVECRGDTGLWWLFYKPEPEQTRKVVDNSEDVKNSLRSKVVDLNQKLAVLTLNDNDYINALKRKIVQMQTSKIVECRGDTGLWWLFYKPQAEQNREVIINNREIVNNVNNVNGRNFQSEAVDLNQRLAVLTLTSNDEVNKLKKQLSEKDLLIEQLRNKLATMNRQIIDLTFNSNMESQQIGVPSQREVPAVVAPKSDKIIQPLIRLPLAVDYLFEQPRSVQAPVAQKSENIIQPLIRLPLAVDYLFEQPKIVEAPREAPKEVSREAPVANDSVLIEELNKERMKNQELNQVIENMRKEMKSISEYLKETKSCAASLQNVNTPVTVGNAEELASLAEYLKETKRSLEAYKINNAKEMSSITNYLKDTLTMAQEYKANVADNFGNQYDNFSDAYAKYESDKKYDSEETVENQQFGY